MRGIGGHGFLLRLGGGRPRFRRVVRPVEVHEHRHRAHQEEGIEPIFRTRKVATIRKNASEPEAA